MNQHADVILTNGRFATLDPANPEAQAVAISDGVFTAVGDRHEVQRLAGPKTQQIDLGNRRVIPGLMDSHIHLIRGGLTYNLELRWDGVRSLAEAMRMLKVQVDNTPPPQWVRVIGGYSEQQFVEKRLPTLDEINQIAPDTPVIIFHLYDRAFLNGAALRACGYTKDTPDLDGAFIQRDKVGNPTGLIVAKPNPYILYATLDKAPKLNPEQKLNSTRHFMRELNRFGVTSIIDAGGGFHHYPEDYKTIEQLHANGELTIRVGYNLLPQAGAEVKDFTDWAKLVKPREGTPMYRHNGGGEMLVATAGDFEDFRQLRPELPGAMEGDLEAAVRVLLENRWSFRMHATYDETISRALDVFEKVAKDVPFDDLHWFFDHAETISQRSIDRIAALGGGVAIQHRMAFQGDYFIEQYGAARAEETPPIKRMMHAGLAVGAGTDATRVSTHNPWVALHWLVTGKTVAGTNLWPQRNCIDRLTALRLWTHENTWFSEEEGKKGRIKEGEYADLAALSGDFFSVPEDDIAGLSAVLTMVAGKVVHGTDEFKHLAPPLPPAAPDWSPVRRFGGYQSQGHGHSSIAMPKRQSHGDCAHHGHGLGHSHASSKSLWGAGGCTCWAF